MSITTAAPPERCPRCSARLIRNHEERECLVHGTVWTVTRAGDLLDGACAADGPEYEAVVGRRSRRSRASGFGGGVPITAEERAAWAAMERGEFDHDPEDGEEDEVTQPVGEAMSAVTMGQVAAKRVRNLAEIVRKHEALIAAAREEAAAMVKVAELCGAVIAPELLALVVVPKGKGKPASGSKPPATSSGEFACDQCDGAFASLQGLSTHKARKHGPGWDTSKNLRGRPDTGESSDG